MLSANAKSNQTKRGNIANTQIHTKLKSTLSFFNACRRLMSHKGLVANVHGNESSSTHKNMARISLQEEGIVHLVQVVGCHVQQKLPNPRQNLKERNQDILMWLEKLLVRGRKKSQNGCSVNIHIVFGTLQPGWVSCTSHRTTSILNQKTLPIL